MPAGKRNSAHEKTPDCCDPRSDRQADWRVSEQKSDVTHLVRIEQGQVADFEDCPAADSAAPDPDRREYARSQR